MYIKSVVINNFRNFKESIIHFNSFNIIIGENDSGKSNLIDALKLPLSLNNLEYQSKMLKISDFNMEVMNNFFSFMNKHMKELTNSPAENLVKQAYSLLPCISVEVIFAEPQNSYERAMLKDFIDDNETGVNYKIRYSFTPRKSADVIEYFIDLMNDGKILSDFLFPIEYYDYIIISPNNEKRISPKVLSNFSINVINAERDDFSENENRKSNKLISNLINKNLGNEDKSQIHLAYVDFFSAIESAESFKKAFKYLENDDFQNFEDYIKTIKLIPNFPDLKNIFSNITMGYGEEFLHQKGLGTRNFILLMVLFSYYHDSKEKYNLICIEEPEAHLCVNKMNLLLDFIEKSIKKPSTLNQVILTSHNPKIINKLKLENVTVIRNNQGINFSKINNKLVSYLAKRPNFDTLKLLFSKRVILVEGPTEEMFINSLLKLQTNMLIEIEVISVGHKGFKTYLDIWLELNKENENFKIAVVRDFDNQPNAKEEHDEYDRNYTNIYVRTTSGYTFEDDLSAVNDNIKILAKKYKIAEDAKSISEYLKKKKAENMLDLCLEISDDSLKLKPPSHIEEVIKCLTERAVSK